MKSLKVFSIIAMAITVITIVSCNNKNQANPNLTKAVIGTYEGTLTTNNLKGTSPATADISAVNDYTVQIHCYGDDLDTTFMLELYEDGNTMRVCFTDEDFYSQYGHGKTEQHHMMGNSGSWTNWSQHMGNDHGQGDVHYGYFNMSDHQFNYTFNIDITEGNTYTQEFSGILQ